METFFSEFWEINTEDISDDLKIDDKTLKNNSSIRFLRFISALEANFDIEISNPNSIMTFGDILEYIKM